MNAAHADLRVGASRVEITPPFVAGTEGPTGKYEHERLYVRAIVIENGSYIPDDASFSHNTFQVINSHLKEGCAEDAIADGLTKIILQYEGANDRAN